jgi:hypothetical protein
LYWWNGVNWVRSGTELIYNGSYVPPLNANYDFETDLSGWSVAGNTALARITTDFYSGSACMQITHTGAGGGANCLGLNYGGSLPKIPYTTAIRVKGVGSTIGKTVTLQSNETGGSQPGAGMLFGSIVLTSGWQVVQATGTPVQSDRAGTNILLGLNSGVSSDVWLVDVAGIVPLSRMYTDGDIVIGSDGGTYMDVRPTIASPKPWGSSVADPNFTDWVPLGYGSPSQLHRVGTYLARPVANAVFPGTTYYATDSLGTWISDGTQWILIAQRPAFGLTSMLGTAPWNTPYDGMECVLVDSLSAPTYQWHFRYNASSSSAYKWEFIGGADWISMDENDVTTTSVNPTYALIGTLGVLIVPRNGEYIIDFATNYYNSVVGQYAYSFIFHGGSNTSLGVYHNNPTAGVWVTVGGRTVKATLNAGNQVDLRHAVGSGTGHFGQRSLSIRPVRVS